MKIVLLGAFHDRRVNKGFSKSINDIYISKVRVFAYCLCMNK